ESGVLACALAIGEPQIRRRATRGDGLRSPRRSHRGRCPHGRHDARDVPQVIRTGRSELYSGITDEMLDAAFSDRDQREMLRAIAPRSAMIVPMAAHGRTLGALVLASAESKRSFTGEDLAMAEELGRHAGLAI